MPCTTTVATLKSQNVPNSLQSRGKRRIQLQSQRTEAKKQRH